MPARTEALGRPPNIRRAALGALLAVLVLAGGSVLVPGPVTDLLIEERARQDALRWRQRLLALVSAGSDAFLIGALTEEDRRRLDLFSRASDVFRLTLLRADGRVFWSSRASDVGTTRAGGGEPAARLAAGETIVSLGTRPAAEVDRFTADQAGRPFALGELRAVAEIMVPVLRDGRRLGTVVFLTDVTEARAAMLGRIRLAVSGLAGLGVLASIGLVLLVWSAALRRERVLAAVAAQERASLAEDRRRAREVQLLSELSEWLQACKTLDELFEMIRAVMSNVFGSSSGSLHVYSNSRDVLDGACAWNGAPLPREIQPDSCWGLRRGRPYEYGANAIDFPCAHVGDREVYAYVCFPILAHGETIGLLHLARDPAAAAEDFAHERRLAQLCAEQISLAIANVRLRDQLRDQSIRDPLTGLYNRRHFTEVLRSRIAAAQRSGGSLALVSLDVDHFKKFNDNHGHDAGDMVLRAVAASLERIADGDELPCRLGGEEFVLLLPGADAAAAAKRAETLRRAVERIAVRYGEKTLPHVTISLGVAAFPEHGDHPQALMKSADDMLYEAKARGRNQVCVAGAAAAPPAGAADAGEVSPAPPGALPAPPDGPARPEAPQEEAPRDGPGDPLEAAIAAARPSRRSSTAA